MVGFGMKASEQELHTMLDYLAEQYPAEDLSSSQYQQGKGDSD